jgi:hypothetical protein
VTTWSGQGNHQGRYAPQSGSIQEPRADWLSKGNVSSGGTVKCLQVKLTALACLMRKATSLMEYVDMIVVIVVVVGRYYREGGKVVWSSKYV